MAQVSEPINLTQTTPPMPQWIGAALNKTLAELGAAGALDSVLRTHRFSGFQADRAAGAKWLQRRFGRPLDPEQITVTNGTQNAILILLSQLVKRGGLLVTEALTYHGLHAHAKLLGFDIQGLAMDDDGLIPEAFEAACRKRRPDALFLMPVLQNPTTAIIPLARRHAIIAVARQYGVQIIEDDVYGLLPAEAPPPIAALAPDIAWHAAGLAKSVATGLRISYLVSPDALAARRLIEPLKTTSTWFVAPLSAAVATRWIEDGTAERLLKDIRVEARERQLIAKRWLAGYDYLTKPESIHLWLTLPPHLTRDAFQQRAREAGVALYGSDAFAAEPHLETEAVRLTLGKPTDRAEVEAGFEIVANILAEGSRAQPVRKIA